MLAPAAFSADFFKCFGQQPQVAVFCPGRVNLIGEHIDYNGGPVMPFAIDRGITVLAAKNELGTIRLASVGRDGIEERQLLNITPQKNWTDHAVGVADLLIRNGLDVRGCDLLYASDLPEGSGLSSSAAFEVATYKVLCQLFAPDGFDPVQAALGCQAVENTFIGVKCGIMDQYAVANCRDGQAMLLDCATLNCDHVNAVIEGYDWVVMDSRTPRTLAASAYNVRRAQCESALEQIRRVRPELVHLASARMDDLSVITQDTERKRARHVVTETARVQRMAEALARKDPDSIGSILKDSHASLRDDYEVSSPELDALVDAANGHIGCAGARMTGAGFGGCCIALVRTDDLETFQSTVVTAFQSRFGRAPYLFVARPSNGVHSIEIR